MNDNVEATLAHWKGRIDAELERVAASHDELPQRLRDAIHYSVTGDGKRVRGMLLMAGFEAVRGEGDASALAAAVEIVHAYSLVHDDLPCMDDATLRRGRATTHRAFDVATATIAGVTMVPVAVQQAIQASKSLGLDHGRARRLVTILMQASGASGMVGGQLMDLEAEGTRLSVAELETVHRAKTGALIAAAITIGGLAGSGTQTQVTAFEGAGQALGLAFQIADDVLDATQSSEALGKTAGKDVALEKSTYASALGVAAAAQRKDSLVADAMSCLDGAELRTPMLEHLAHFVAARRS